MNDRRSKIEWALNVIKADLNEIRASDLNDVTKWLVSEWIEIGLKNAPLGSFRSRTYDPMTIDRVMITLMELELQGSIRGRYGCSGFNVAIELEEDAILVRMALGMDDDVGT